MEPSGIGKTTLLRLIGTQLTPNRREIWFDGVNIPALPCHTLNNARKISMLFQSSALFSDMTVFKNGACPWMRTQQPTRPLLRSTVLMTLEAVQLRGAAALMPNELGSGMAGRAALAQAIALDPK